VSTALTTKMIGPYLMLEKLGEGAFSKVKMGVHHETGLKVAVKIIDNDAMDTQKMQREIALSRMLDHPNVVRLYDVFELKEKNATCLVMDFCEGGDMCDYLSRYGPLPEPEAVRIMGQLVDALIYCHEKKVIHRDLKPDNILLTEDMNVKISDFGLSGMLKPGAFLESFCGSAPYCSPEILRRQQYIGPEVDVWALGVVMYTLLTARFPWPGKHWDQQIQSALVGKWAPAPEITAPARDMLNRMLQPDTLKRVTLPEIRQHPWLSDGSGLTSIPRALSESEVQAEVLQNLAAVGFHPSEIRQHVTQQVASPGAVLYHIIAGRPGPRTPKRSNTIGSGLPVSAEEPTPRALSQSSEKGGRQSWDPATDYVPQQPIMKNKKAGMFKTLRKLLKKKATMIKKAEEDSSVTSS